MSLDSTSVDLQAHPALAGITVFERGWLSSNNVLIHARGDEPGAVLVDSGHVSHAAQTEALVRHALQGRPLARIVNTHLHSDHCGGNAALQRAFGAEVLTPPGHADAVRRWDEETLSYAPTGQHCERFELHGTLVPGEPVRAGGRQFEVIAAPGHDPESVVLFDAASGLLISADALWENGFGVVFPELEGESAFDDVATVLDMIERLPVSVVVPGHGRPFTDVPAALARARTRLASFVNDPQRHARYAAKVLISFHLMEVRGQTLPELVEWVERTRYFASVWQSSGQAESRSPAAWGELLASELVASGAARRVGERIEPA
ncbi:MBL fold metallo-hydrolase [Piscinibacter gummiphilus]|uniref:MBL fold metallo-hydrolase n=1 Tax=Piscinibacter gummiphilus TaxID=946333 RepID=A0ABZ0CRW9_9BURK|nr:MBL fold metallo-hydrolase [Piscinibacter gummiphilus]WOB07729.1 MBL fold metallo-hydrolase [Piscinibacter gummiphilus]